MMQEFTRVLAEWKRAPPAEERSEFLTGCLDGYRLRIVPPCDKATAKK